VSSPLPGNRTPCQQQAPLVDSGRATPGVIREMGWVTIRGASALSRQLGRLRGASLTSAALAFSPVPARFGVSDRGGAGLR
jgi:hypothetical protein